MCVDICMPFHLWFISCPEFKKNPRGGKGRIVQCMYKMYIVHVSMVSGAKSGPEQGALQEEYLCNNHIKYERARKKVKIRNTKRVNLKARINKN